MFAAYALAAVVTAAGAASAQVRLVPSRLALAPRLAAPAVEMRVLGVPGPGVTPAHIEAVKVMAAQVGSPILIHGSRQTGVSHRTGLPFKHDADLDLGVVGPPGHLVIAPPVERLPGELGTLQKHAKPWRTDEQLSKLAATVRSREDSFKFAVSRGTIPNFWNFIKGLILSGTKTPYLTVIGNHDRHKPHGITNDRVYRGVYAHSAGAPV